MVCLYIPWCIAPTYSCSLYFMCFGGEATLAIDREARRETCRAEVKKSPLHIAARFDQPVDGCSRGRRPSFLAAGSL